MLIVGLLFIVCLLNQWWFGNHLDTKEWSDAFTLRGLDNIQK